MNALLRPALLAVACTVAFPSMAADRCEHSRNEQPALDLAGIERVRIAFGADTLVVTAGAPTLAVRHCASTPERLEGSALRVERRGNELVINTTTASFANFNWFADSDYLLREIALSLPANVPLTLDVGSGEASVTERVSVTVELGSGDVALHRIGRVIADVGSGDLQVMHARSLELEVGSGDAIVERIEEAVSVDVGAGEAALRDIGSLARVEVGSGEVVARLVRGDARIADVGAGEVSLEDVRGRVHIGRIGSGEVVVDGVAGDVHVADRKDVENLRSRRVSGKIIIDG